MSTGAFVREEARFRDRVSADGSTPFPVEAGRYHLYVALACPWSHRAVIARRVKRLESAISISYIHPYRDERGWAFTGGEFADPVNGFSFLSEAYEASRPGYEGRVTVPVLWDRETGQIVNNESADLLCNFDAEFAAVADGPAPELYPADLRDEIDALNERIYETVNNGVYRAGFARSQEAYEEAFFALFETLAWLEERLSTRRYLCGDRITEADWRLFVTLVRFDAVYHTHFRCNGRRLVDHPNLYAYTRDLYQQPGIAETVAMDQIKRHYYTTHAELNPKGIIPAGPLDVDFTAPHGRERLGRAA
jgi:putative glutathione S-transferase